MKRLPGCCFILLAFLVESCMPYSVDPALSSYVNTDPSELTFTNQAGDEQILKVDVKRGLHGTGPFGPQQRNLQTSYSPSLIKYKFYLEVDGDDGHYYLIFAPEDSYKPGPGSEMLLMPCQDENWDCGTKVKMHNQVLLNGKVFQEVLAFSVKDSFHGEYSLQDEHQGFDSLYLARQQGLVGFTNSQGETYSLRK